MCIRDRDGLNRLMVDLCMGCGSCTFVCPAKRPVAQTMSLAKVMPVSYTHLDVYKRQVSPCAWKPMP